MLAYTVGLRPSETSAICPAEVYRFAKIHNQNKRDQIKTSMSLAYAGAAWQRAKKMPDLNSVLRKIDGPENPKQTFKNIVSAIRAAAKKSKAQKET